MRDTTIKTFLVSLFFLFCLPSNSIPQQKEVKKVFVVSSYDLNYSYRNFSNLLTFYSNLSRSGNSVQIESYYKKNTIQNITATEQEMINNDIRLQLVRFSPDYIIIIGNWAFENFAIPTLYQKFVPSVYYLDVQNIEELKEKYMLEYISGINTSQSLDKLVELLTSAGVDIKYHYFVYDFLCNPKVITNIREKFPTIVEYKVSTFEELEEVTRNLQKKVRGLVFYKFKGMNSTKTKKYITAEELYKYTIENNDKHLEIVMNDNLSHHGWAISLSAHSHLINNNEDDLLYQMIINKKEDINKFKIMVNKRRLKELGYENILKFDKYISQIQEK